MSIVENMAKHSDDIEAEVKNMQDKMAQCETGTRMLQASQEMAMSDEMMGLMEIIGDPDIPEKERVTLAQYMGEMMKDNPANGLEKFAKYLEGVAADPRYAKRKDYYITVANASRGVSNSKVYKDYIVVYNEFENDDSPEAQAAREATEQMQKRMKQWSEG
jgi:hypothetical protein